MARKLYINYGTAEEIESRQKYIRKQIDHMISNTYYLMNTLKEKVTALEKQTGQHFQKFGIYYYSEHKE